MVCTLSYPTVQYVENKMRYLTISGGGEGRKVKELLMRMHHSIMAFSWSQQVSIGDTK
jgi:hypothetical protein